MKFNPSKYRNFPILRSDLIPLFWLKIDKLGSTQESQVAMLAGRVQYPCHLWIKCKFPDGYGQFGWYSSGPNIYHCYSHILAYFLAKNDLPQERGLELDHLCRVRHCCNPDHLEPVLGVVNKHRGNQTIISEDDICLIFHLRSIGWTQQRISRIVGISRSCTGFILSGKNRGIP